MSTIATGTASPWPLRQLNETTVTRVMLGEGGLQSGDPALRAAGEEPPEPDPQPADAPPRPVSRLDTWA
ncbi:MAG: hypothetical protein IT204_03450 [Fimbriimonadaceae bacterium]|nr:hypothetical protein [Fimbriimonadaceae bacterium]